MKRICNLIFVAAVVVLLGCAENEDIYVPKPHGFPRIDLPEQVYQPLKEKHPYTFEYSKHARTQKHQSSQTEPHWIDINYPDFNAEIQLTYKSLNGDKKKLAELIRDAHKLTSKHDIRASSIEPAIFTTSNGKKAVIIELEGQVPSRFQFYITDSTNNFLRGALYFNTASKNDSLAPVVQFIKEDIIHLINTLEWTE